MTEYKNAIVKMNGGAGALLCSHCNTIIATGMVHKDIAHSCDECSNWQEIIDYLAGSCNSLNSALDMFDAEHLDMHDPFLKMLDDEIFLCNTCDWWCPIEEANMNSELTCNDCCDQESDEEE